MNKNSINTNQNNPVNLGVYLEIIIRRKWLILLPTTLGIALGTIVAIVTPPTYRSSTLILIEPQQISTKYVNPTDSAPIEARLNTLRQQIMSRTKIEQILKKFQPYKSVNRKGATGFLTETIKTVKKMLAESLKKIGLASHLRIEETGVSTEERVERMRKDLEVKILRGGRKGGSAFTISYIGKDPYVTMQITNAFASLYIEENLKVREQYTEGTSAFLINELEKAKIELEDQEITLREFKEKNMGYLPEQLDANLRTLDRLQLELQSVETLIRNVEEGKMLQEQRLRDALEGALLQPTPMISAKHEQKPTLNQVELQNLKSRLSNLLSVFKSNYPDVIIVKKRIAELKKHIENENSLGTEEGKKAINKSYGKTSKFKGKEDIDKIKIQITTARAQIKTLKKRTIKIKSQIKNYEKRVEFTPANEQKLASIVRDYGISQRNYHSLLEKKLSARLAENLEKRQKGERFRIIDSANLPEKPFKPNRSFIVFVGMLIGLGLGSCIVYMLDFLNPPFRRAEEIAQVLPIPILATIPKFSKVSLKKIKNDKKRV